MLSRPWLLREGVRPGYDRTSVSFADRVIARLVQVRTVSEADLVDAQARPDFARHYRQLVEMLSTVEQGGTMARQFVERILRLYPRPLLELFVDELHWHLLSGFAGRDSARDRHELIERALVLQLDLEDVFPFSMSLSRRHALLDSASQAWSTAQESIHYGAAGQTTRYCEELRLFRWDESPRVTPSGRTLLGLRGSDVLRWLLALEVGQATASSDPWRLHGDAVAELFRYDGRVFFDGEEESPDLPWDHVKRLATVGLLTLVEDVGGHGVYGWQLTDVGRDVLGALGSDTNPFQLLARAFVEDTNRSHLSPAGGGPGSTAASDATLRHARMVAHEIRNALLPVRAGLRAVWSVLDAGEKTQELNAARERVDAGIARVYDFVDRSVRLVDPSRDPDGRFDLVDAIDEARTQLDAPAALNLGIIITPAGATPRCRGSKDRLAVAVLNLLRNAVQVGATRIEVRIAERAGEPGHLEVSVEDDGPGIAPQDRKAVLENGVTSRSDGVGHGLTVVRQIVQSDFDGSVSIGASDLGGAKFSLVLNAESGSK